MFKLETDQTYSADIRDGEQWSRDDNDDGRGIDRVEGGYMYEKIETAQRHATSSQLGQVETGAEKTTHSWRQ